MLLFTYAPPIVEGATKDEIVGLKLTETLRTKKYSSIVIGLLFIACLIGLYQLTKEEPKRVVTVTSSKEKVLPKVKRAKVQLQVSVTACQKIKIAVPLESGTITTSDDMRVAKGFVENIGKVPVQFVQVQIIWKDKDDKSVDASTVFAVTNETLLPGERAGFQTSKRNYLINRCNARIIDWWVVDKATDERLNSIPKSPSKKDI
ncbi:MAG: hypothetical protein ACI9FB_002033 [Candidatus Azotimanducaceae bacterium]